MYTAEDLIKIAKRENNNKRKYLLVNTLQGKHIPVSPSAALGMFRELAGTLIGAYRGEKLLLVGFAETATAIGAAVAVEMGCSYMQTTREVIPGAEYLFFSEAHSHATEQKLVKNDIDSLAREIGRIVFVEDEVTTGNTIMNIVDILERDYPGAFRYSVASILNGMDEGALKRFRDRAVDIHYLVKISQGGYTQAAEQYEEDGVYIGPDLGSADGLYRELEAGGWVDARRAVNSEAYQEACTRLYEAVKADAEKGQSEAAVPGAEKGHRAAAGPDAGKGQRAAAGPDDAGKGQRAAAGPDLSIGRTGTQRSMLVIGTEEFMYPALYVASRFEEDGVEVKCHSTTRSPIAVCSAEEYPLHKRYELKSLYDSGRKTFIYDLGSYDSVLIITDSQDWVREGINSLVNALVKAGNNNIRLVRWCR